MWGIALRNFLLQGHRYRVLVTALILGGTVFTLLFGVTASLTKTVREKAARYFSGDLVVLAVERKNDFVIDHEAEITTAIRQSGIAAEAYHRRSLYYSGDAQLFFDGESLIQRRVVGVDFGQEFASFATMDFTDGAPPSAEGSPDGLWVSDDTARRLHLHVGDQVTLMMATIRGYKNTLRLKIEGIFADSSLFGFACYLDYRVLNGAVGRPTEAITELGLTLPSSWNETLAAQNLQRALEPLVPMAPLVITKEALDKWSKANRTAPKSYGVLTLTGRLKQINDLINAVQLVNLLLTTVFLFIVSIGVYNTYQMVIFERVKEIGTMRALGLTRSGVVQLFLSECVILGLLGALAGLGLGTLALFLLGSVDFSGNLLAEMFLVKGHLAWVWPWENVLQVVAVMMVTSIAGATAPALRAAQQRPVDALRNE